MGDCRQGVIQGRSDAGTYKIPTANDIPLDLRVTLLADAPCKRTPQAHSSKAVGEPPLFLGASVFFALKARTSALPSHFAPRHASFPHAVILLSVSP